MFIRPPRQAYWLYDLGKNTIIRSEKFYPKLKKHHKIRFLDCCSKRDINKMFVFLLK